MCDDLAPWVADCRREAHRYVRDRLLRYPIFQFPLSTPYADSLALKGVSRTCEIVKYHGADSVALQHSVHRLRWFRVVSHREALRLVFEPEPCEMALQKLDAGTIRLLRWLYVDQLTNEELARVLKLQVGRSIAFDACAAQQRGLLAYQAFCAALEQRFRSQNQPLSGPHRDVSAAFPLFPAGTVQYTCPAHRGAQE